MDNKHPMTTRSKCKLDKNELMIPIEDINEIKQPVKYEELDELDELDEYSNLKNFVIYDGDDSNFKTKLNHQMKSIQKKKKLKKNPMGNLLLNYILLKANEEKKHNKHNKHNKHKLNKIICDEEDTITTDEDTASDDELNNVEKDISIVPINSDD